MSPDPVPRALPGQAAGDPEAPAPGGRKPVDQEHAGQEHADRERAKPGRSAGCFVALVGPSGAGKDTLLTLAMAGLAEDAPIVVARRVVTRAAVASVEDHDAMSQAEFRAASAAGRFCLAWQAHGLSYGLPVELLGAVAAGTSVVANISRRVLPEAAAAFPRLAVVEVTAPPSVLAARIAARGREAPADIEARLARSVALVVPAGVEAVHRIVNDAAPETGADALRDILVGLACVPAVEGRR